MKNALLGLAFAGLALVSCQNTSTNNMEAAGAPGATVCPMGGECDMDSADCDGDCAMGAEGCDMGAMASEGCDMGDCEGMEMDMEACEGMDMSECPMADQN